MKVFSTYILECFDKSYYVGHTDNIELRVAQHQAGEFVSYTSTRLPIKLVFAQDFMTREEAFLMERKLKGWSCAKKEALIKGDFDALRVLSKRKLKK